jgi:peptidyl-prolyl cis-trans isomerase A (cyclophilin A)
MIIALAGALLVTQAAAGGLTVRIDTTYGSMLARLAWREAPITVCNFLRYVSAGDFDGGAFFRTVRSDHIVGNPVPIDVVQAETRHGEDYGRFAPIPLERTSQTGLHHIAGALSMARWGPDTATSSFSIVVKDSPTMDFGGKRNPDGQGFAVFGRVIAGRRVLRAIQHAPADGEHLRAPVRIYRMSIEASTTEVLNKSNAGCQDSSIK